ncbi:MAG: hypothetical protein ACO1O3_04125 [Sphingobium sp.]
MDLRGALLRKQEVEAAALIALVAQHGDEALPGQVPLLCPAAHLPALHTLLDSCRAEARAQLIEERGDPAPYRLA